MNQSQLLFLRILVENNFFSTSFEPVSVENKTSPTNPENIWVEVETSSNKISNQLVENNSNNLPISAATYHQSLVETDANHFGTETENQL